MDSRTYDTLVADFYRAATGAIDWNQALDGVCNAFNARCVPLETVGLGTMHLASLKCGGRDLECPSLDYLRDFYSLNPRVPLSIRHPPGEWLHDHEHFEPAFISNDRFYQDYAAPYGMHHMSGLLIALGPDTIASFSLQLPHERGPLSMEEREWVRRLGEHLREALMAYERVRRLAAEAMAGHGLLSTFTYPMWLIDAERYVFFTNPAAQREVEEGRRLALHGPRLALVNSLADRELTLRIESLYRAGHGSRAVVDLRRTQSDPPTWLHLSLLVPGQVLGAFGERPQVLATLFDPHQVSTLDPFALANIFQFTPAEARVATLLAEGLTLDEIALKNGTRLSTVRTQMSQIFAKLGVARQADVVRVLCQGEALWAKAGG